MDTYIVTIDDGAVVSAFRMTEGEMMKLPEGEGYEISIYHEPTIENVTAEEIIKRFELE